MPNHIENELTAPSEVIDSLTGVECCVTFESVIPMPEVYRNRSPSSRVIDWALIAMGVENLQTLRTATPDPLAAFNAGNYDDAAKRLKQFNLARLLAEGPFPKDWNDEDFDNLISCMRGIKEHGFPSWYEWSTENWGTKWDAYGPPTRPSGTMVKFQTAWSAPLKVIHALSGKFPAGRIRLRWADENYGNNSGDVTILNQEVIAGGRLGNGSVEAENLYIELHHDGELPEDMERLLDGHIRYRDDEDPSADL